MTRLTETVKYYSLKTNKSDVIVQQLMNKISILNQKMEEQKRQESNQCINIDGFPIIGNKGKDDIGSRNHY